MQRARSRQPTPFAIDALIVGGLAAASLAIRLPYLWDIPQFTDEGFDALVAYGIYQGKRPLTGVNAYTGALHYYVEASLYWLFGPSPYIPRLLILTLGVAAVVATYLLGAELGRRCVAAGDPRGRTAGRLAGIVAGGLLATNVVHVVANSHIAWPHCTALLYLTLGVFALERGLRTSNGRWLVTSGLMFGIAQQQHPTMLLFWPPLAIVAMCQGRRLTRTRWPYLALLAMVIGMSPLIAYNLTTGLGSLAESRQQLEEYRKGRTDDFSYRGRAEEIVVTLARIPASAVDARPSATDYLTDPSVIAYSATGMLGLVAAARLRAVSLAAMTASFLLLLPMFPASHDQLPRQGRYLMPLLPLVFAGIGALAASVAFRVPAARLAAVVAAGLLVLFPLIRLTDLYRAISSAGETNSRYFVTLGAVERLRGPQEWVVVDPSLQHDRPGAGANAIRTFDFLLTLSGVPHATLDQSADRIDRRVLGSTALLIADERPGSITTAANAPVWQAQEIENAAPGGFSVWRLTRR